LTGPGSSDFSKSGIVIEGNALVLTNLDDEGKD